MIVARTNKQTYTGKTCMPKNLDVNHNKGTIVSGLPTKVYNSEEIEHLIHGKVVRQSKMFSAFIGYTMSIDYELPPWIGTYHMRSCLYYGGFTVDSKNPDKIGYSNSSLVYGPVTIQALEVVSNSVDSIPAYIKSDMKLDIHGRNHAPKL